jgi:hypothetical protein
VTLYVGDRFEIPLTREAWDAGQVFLDGAFRYLVAATGEPVVVTLRAAGGRSASAVWDGAAGFLAVPDLARFLPAAGDGGRLSLDVEATDAPVFRVALVGPASGEARPDGDGRGQEQAAREIGGARVRFDPGDAGIVGALARGAHSPLTTWRLNRWAHSIAVTPGFDDLVSLPFFGTSCPTSTSSPPSRPSSTECAGARSWPTRSDSVRRWRRASCSPS